MDKIEILKSISLLKGISDENLIEFSKLLTEVNFEKDKNIISEGDSGDTMFILVEGKVDILKTTVFGDIFLCASLDSSTHAVFGEMALIDNDKRSATVKATTDCKTYSITSVDFKKFCKEYPDAGVELLMFISINLVKNLRSENTNLRLVYQALIEEIESK